ncbi:MAG: hypothetical protein J7641_02820 [Cyanobacteria bacterium SID2]|nr:hypothetical protein [Cyanobacteria bacterium SID2]MBP0003871.1 hypothetical protein [Cyanobacteria bacterium SBC]
MTYALRSEPLTPERPSARLAEGTRLDRHRKLRRQRRPHKVRSSARVIPLQAKPVVPAKNVQALVWIRRVSAAVSLTLVAATFGVYSNTVAVQSRWRQATDDLDRLRLQERQLTVAMESLRQHLAAPESEDETESPSLLSNPTVYVEPATPRAVRATTTTAPTPQKSLPAAY